jgi:predicted RNA-binding protein with RPS1 domain
MMELSVRDSLPDPWVAFAQRAHAGDTVRCQVRQILSHGILACIAPGIDGLIRAEDLDHLQPGSLTDSLWVGDHLEAVITQVNITARRVGLSLHQRQDQVKQAQAFMARLLETTPVEAAGESTPSPVEPDQPVVLEGPVMLVEDKDDLRDALTAWLENHGCQVRAFRSFALAEKVPSRCRSRCWATQSRSTRMRICWTGRRLRSY